MSNPINISNGGDGAMVLFLWILFFADFGDNNFDLYDVIVDWLINTAM